jgi:outer membrane protein
MRTEVKPAFLPLAALLLLAVITSSAAQNLDVQPIPDLPLKDVPPAGKLAPPAMEWKVTLGGGLSDRPRYEGAAANRLRLLPFAEATNGHFVAGILRGVGYNFSDDRTLEYGLRLALGHVRRTSSDPHLAGMADIPYSLEAGAFINKRFAPWYVSGGITAGKHGRHAELGGGIGLPLSQRDRMRAGVNLDWGDTRYNQTYFGVSPAEAAASGNVLSAYQAGAGVKDYAVSLNWAHNYTRQWFSTLGLSYKWLTGSARTSPLTLRAEQRSINFILGYRY